MGLIGEKMDNKAVIYARVSSTGERQSTERQVAGECELSTKTVQKVRTALKMKELEKVVHEEEKAILSGSYTVH